MSVELDGANNIVKTDTISEVTSANGVTIDGLSIKDGKLVTANSVIEANMSANSVDSDSYVDGSIDTAHIADGQITVGKLASGVGFRPNVNPLIINGDMAISQRSTSVTGVGNADSGYHTLDRWRFSEGGDNSTEFTMTQDTDVPTGKGFANSLKMDVTTADGSPGSGDAMFLQQRFEGQDLQLLKKGTASAEKITVSFWVKSPKTGVHIVELQDSDTTNARNVSISYTIASANTWEKHIVNFPADTTGALDDDNANSFEINWYLLAGTDFTSGTLATTWEARTSANRAVGQVNVGDNTSNNFYMTGVQLEVGEYTSATIPPFQHETYSDSLTRCHRYYEELANQTYSMVFSCYSVDTAYLQDSYRAIKRTTPTITFTATGVGGLRAYTSGSERTLTNVTSDNRTANAVSFQINGASSPFTAGEAGHLNNTSTGGYYTADAEL